MFTQMPVPGNGTRVLTTPERKWMCSQIFAQAPTTGYVQTSGSVREPGTGNQSERDLRLLLHNNTILKCMIWLKTDSRKEKVTT